MVKSNIQWLIYTILAAISTALVAIFGKKGLQRVDMLTATGIRAGIIFVVIIVLMLLTNKIQLVTSLDAKSLFYIFLSG